MIISSRKPSKIAMAAHTTATEKSMEDMTMEELMDYYGEPTFICVLCDEEKYGYGHNPWPVVKNGECCGNCNTRYVIPICFKRSGHPIHYPTEEWHQDAMSGSEE